MPVAVRKRVLIVDDETKIVRLLSAFLEAEGYEVATATSGTAALDAVVAQPPDLMILDLRLPDISGFEVSSRLRENYDHTTLPIVMITAMDRPEDKACGFEHGADAYMSKPFELSELNRTITTLLDQEEQPA